MGELPVTPDSEAAVLAELSSVLPLKGWPGLTTAAQRVGTKIPAGNTKPESFVRVLALGGLGRDLVADSPTLVVEGWHKSEGKAFDLCALSVAILEAAGRAGSLGGVTCYGVDVSGLPGNLPHPTVPDRFRYTATLSVHLRKVIL